MTKRDEKQKEFSSLILNIAKEHNSIHHSFVAGTGVGKSKIIMDLLKPLKEILNYKKILILVDNTRLRDHNWKEDFEKWGYKVLYSQEVETNTYQTCYKWDKSLDDYLIIADEIDFACTPEYGKFLDTYKDNNIIGMTGYIADSKREFLNSKLPIIFEYDQQQAQQDGVLNSINIVFVKYDLYKDKSIEVEYANKSKKFKTSENASYNYWDKELRIRLGKENSAQAQATLTGDYSALKKAMKLREIAASKRAGVLYSSKSAVEMARRIMNDLLSEGEESKVIVFSTRTESADAVSSYSYHNKNTDEINAKRFEDFNSGKIRELSLVDKINRGVNITGLDHLVFMHFNGSDTKLRQRLGRSMRLNPEDFATIFVLLPYFMRKTPKTGYVQAQTAAVKWAINMFKGWDLSKAKVLDFRSIKSKL